MSRKGDDFAFLGEMCSVEEQQWNETLQLNGEKPLDTDMCVTAIPSSMYSVEKHGPLQMPQKELFGPSKQRLETGTLQR